MNIRSFFRNLILNLISINSEASNKVHILNGHFIQSTLNENSKSFFENFINSLKNNFEIIDLKSAIQLINEKHKCEKPKVSITFDDGFEECYSIMLPILEKHNIKATFFINPMSIENQKSSFTKSFIYDNLKVDLQKCIMNWDMLREINDLGHIIGSHTYSHANLKGLAKSKLQYEIIDSKYKIESELNTNCDFFAFPFGNDNYFDANSVDLVTKNYKFGFTSGLYNKYFYKNNKQILSRRHFECDIPFKHLLYFTSKKRKY